MYHYFGDEENPSVWNLIVQNIVDIFYIPFGVFLVVYLPMQGLAWVNKTLFSQMADYFFTLSKGQEYL